MNGLDEMLSMQNALNEQTNGSDWRSGTTTLGKPIDWRRCIYMETAELIDSYPWKHWKSVSDEPDMENARLELVDIWHFVLSLALENFDQPAAKALLEKGWQNSTPRSNTADIKTQVDTHENLMRTALSNQTVSESYLVGLVTAFFASCYVVGLNLQALHETYMAKHVLNRFRQDHGYQEGRYIKQWQGREDNQVMFELIAEMQAFSGEALYRRLQQAYEKIERGEQL